MLNFGVGGYGVDQSYLRFKKDVLPWKPDVAILGFPFSDLQRSLTVYPFISSPHWGIPFSKPRVVLNDGLLRILNVPTIPPQTMFAMGSISDLPFLKYDYGYRGDQWEWRIRDLSYAKRWLFSYFGRDPQPADEELIRVNEAILRAFLELADEHDIVPIIAFFPGGAQIRRLMRGEETEMQAILERLASAVPIVDTTPCVLDVGFPAAYVPDDPHYSPRGNAAVAKCISKALEPILTEQKAKRGLWPGRRSRPAMDRPTGARASSELCSGSRTSRWRECGPSTASSPTGSSATWPTLRTSRPRPPTSWACI